MDNNWRKEMIIIESKRKKPETILKKYPDAILADVTSGAKDGPFKIYCGTSSRDADLQEVTP